jgi:hypothetical protein
MAHGNMAIDTVQFTDLLFIVQVGFTTFLGQSQGIIVLVTVDTGRLKGMTFGMIDL